MNGGKWRKRGMQNGGQKGERRENSGERTVKREISVRLCNRKRGKGE